MMDKQCTVSIIMGSKSDLPVMQKAAQALEEFGIAWEIRSFSAHRTPDRVIAYAQGLRERGVKVVIAGAGMAAHLPGVIAALTTLPVIGVPLESGGMGGMDALLSIAQMPPGIPVACVAVGGARNAAILAVELLALSNAEIEAKLSTFREKMRAEVDAADQQVREAGLGK